MRGVFVTGTGTAIGKTVVAAVIAHGLAAGGERVAVFKPVLTGLTEGGEPDHELLRRASGTRQPPCEIAPHRFGPAVSPHLAAELAGVRLEPAELVAAAREAAAGADTLVCEGVGGLLVPLTPGYLVRDFARELELPLLIAASPALGTINHTLMSVEAARAVGLEVCCIILTPWPGEPGVVEISNLETLRRLAGTEVETLAEIDLSEPGGWPPVPEPVAERLRR